MKQSNIRIVCFLPSGSLVWEVPIMHRATNSPVNSLEMIFLNKTVCNLNLGYTSMVPLYVYTYNLHNLGGNNACSLLLLYHLYSCWVGSTEVLGWNVAQWSRVSHQCTRDTLEEYKLVEKASSLSCKNSNILLKSLSLELCSIFLCGSFGDIAGIESMSSLKMHLISDFPFTNCCICWEVMYQTNLPYVATTTSTCSGINISISSRLVLLRPRKSLSRKKVLLWLELAISRTATPW